MGQISLTIGALSRSLTAPDGKMTDVLADVVAATGGPMGGTSAEKADWVLLLIKRHLVDVANGGRHRAARETAEAGVMPVDLE